MRYFVCSNKNGKIDIIEEYETEDAALKRLKYHYKKEKCRLEILPVPELKVGCMIYRRDKSYYGRVEYETGTLWGILCGRNGNTIPDPYGKQRIDKWIINQGFIIAGCEEVPDTDAMIGKAEDLKLKVDKALLSLQDPGAAQVTFF